MRGDAGVHAAVHKAGGRRKLAFILQITRDAVAQWDRVPLGRVLEIEEKIGVPRHVLRPDRYSENDKGSSAPAGGNVDIAKALGLARSLCNLLSGNNEGAK